jgi:hypothetical protein
MLYDVANRGRIALATSLADAGAMADLFKRGYVLLSSGWQGDMAPAEGIETISVPIAKNADGSIITGPVLVRFSDMQAARLRYPSCAAWVRAFLRRCP